MDVGRRSIPQSRSRVEVSKRKYVPWQMAGIRIAEITSSLWISCFIRTARAMTTTVDPNATVKKEHPLNSLEADTNNEGFLPDQDGDLPRLDIEEGTYPSLNGLHQTGVCALEP